MTGSAAQVADTPDDEPAERLRKPAMIRGWRGCCPSCGGGRLLHSYLKVHDHCTVCEQEFHHHRADDGPAYLTLLIVGHLMGFMLHFVFVTFRPEPIVLFTIFSVGSIALSLYLLPRFKGAMIGFQWAKEMGGFARKS